MDFFRGFPQIMVHAQDWNALEDTDVATIGSLEGLFSNLVTGVLSLSGVTVFVMLLVSGFTFLFAGGDPKRLEAARGTFTNAIIGLVIIVSAYLILRIIGVFTGTETQLMNFTIPTQ